MNEQTFRDKFAPRVSNATLEKLPGLIREILDEGSNDYGCAAISAGLIGAAAMWAANKELRLTEFQASFSAWEVLRHWDSLYPRTELGGRMQDFGDLLYPRCEHKFTSLPKDVVEALPKEAQKKLDENPNSHPEVLDHWRRLAAGELPFGLRADS